MLFLFNYNKKVNNNMAHNVNNNRRPRNEANNNNRVVRQRVTRSMTARARDEANNNNRVVSQRVTRSMTARAREAEASRARDEAIPLILTYQSVDANHNSMLVRDAIISARSNILIQPQHYALVNRITQNAHLMQQKIFSNPQNQATLRRHMPSVTEFVQEEYDVAMQLYINAHNHTMPNHQNQRLIDDLRNARAQVLMQPQNQQVRNAITNARVQVLNQPQNQHVREAILNARVEILIQPGNEQFIIAAFNEGEQELEQPQNQHFRNAINDADQQILIQPQNQEVANAIINAEEEILNQPQNQRVMHDIINARAQVFEQPQHQWFMNDINNAQTQSLTPRQFKQLRIGKQIQRYALETAYQQEINQPQNHQLLEEIRHATNNALRHHEHGQKAMELASLNETYRLIRNQPERLLNQNN